MKKILDNYKFFIIFFLSSPILRILNFPLIILLAFAFFFSICSFEFRFSAIRKFPILLIVVYFFTIFTLVIWYKSFHFFLYFFGFFMAFVVVRTLKINVINKYIERMSFLLFFMLVGSLIGLIFHFVGVGYIYEFSNPNGDKNFFYFLTLTNSESGLFIRPSGFFAEPGYLGFIVSLIVFLRQIYGKNSNFSFLLILLTFITQSIVFFLFAFFWFLDFSSHNSTNLKSNIKKYSFILLSLVPLFMVIKFDFFDWVQERVIGFVDDDLFNARSIAWFDLIEKISSQPLSGIIFGFDLDCIFRNESCFTLGGVPLVPLLFGGLLYSWPYYFFIIYLLFLSFNTPRIRFSSIGFVFVVFSQPVFLELPYSLIYLFLLHSILEIRKISLSISS